MSTLQITLIVVIALPALAIVVWPLLGRRARVAAAPERAPDDRRLELEEEKAALYRALRELEFDHDAGHLSDPDYLSLRERYESRAAALITELDLLPGGPEMAPELSRPRTTVSGAERVSGTRHPATLAAGAVALLIFGVIIGVNAGRFTERDESVMPGPAPSPVGPPAARLEPGKPIPPEVLAGMLSAARQSLFEGRYSEAIAAYQAVLKRDERNVDAMTHLGLIVAVGGHADSALATFDRALKIDPKYAPAYLYRGQVLYEQKQDYVGAVAAWERFMALAPNGEDRDRVAELVKQARGKQQAR